MTSDEDTPNNEDCQAIVLDTNLMLVKMAASQISGTRVRIDACRELCQVLKEDRTARIKRAKEMGYFLNDLPSHLAEDWNRYVVEKSGLTEYGRPYKSFHPITTLKAIADLDADGDPKLQMAALKVLTRFEGKV